MKIELVSFGALTIEGKHYTNDIIIKKGEIKKRNKKASKAYRDQYNHTPLSAEEDIPWKGSKLFIGTGKYGSLPIMSTVYDEAKKRNIEVIAKPTDEICQLLKSYDRNKVNAIIHITC